LIFYKGNHQELNSRLWQVDWAALQTPSLVYFDWRRDLVDAYTKGWASDPSQFTQKDILNFHHQASNGKLPAYFALEEDTSSNSNPNPQITKLNARTYLRQIFDIKSEQDLLVLNYRSDQYAEDPRIRDFKEQFSLAVADIYRRNPNIRLVCATFDLAKNTQPRGLLVR
jgi:hypothetical protein